MARPFVRPQKRKHHLAGTSAWRCAPQLGRLECVWAFTRTPAADASAHTRASPAARRPLPRTGLPFIDGALSGGLRPHDVLEIVADAGKGGAGTGGKARASSALGSAADSAATASLLHAAAAAAVAGVVSVYIDCAGRTGATSVEGAVRRRLAEVGATHLSTRRVTSRVLMQRCHSSAALLLALKRLPQVVADAEAVHGEGCVRMLLIDSLGAFYWTDRAAAASGTSAAAAPGGGGAYFPSAQTAAAARAFPPLALHSIYPALAREVGEVARMLRLAVLVSRVAVFARKQREIEGGALYAEYLPTRWQECVSHRLVISETGSGPASDGDQAYVASWERPTRLPPRRFTFDDLSGAVRMR